MVSLFRNAFGGLTREVWLLSLVMLINRSGTMVIAFMSVYLTQKLHFSVEKTGFIMVSYGLGSLCGTWVGGKLTDKIGYFFVQFWSLFMGGLLFIFIVQVHHFYMLCGLSFVLSAFGEAYRPANTASIADFSTPETFTRSISLIRLAINLGWAIGPALGGFLASKNYDWLFYADGLTNICAAIMVWFFLKSTKKKKSDKHTQPQANKKDSVYKDKVFLVFIVLVTMYAISFFQLFTIGPLFYKQECGLSEIQIGYLLGLNGLLVVIIEMILVYKIDGKIDKLSLISLGVFLVVINYLIFILTHQYWLLVVGIIFATLSEIFAMPYMNTFSIERSKPHNRGEYSGLYAMTWSVANITAPLVSTQVISHLGFNTLWYILGSFGLLSALGFGLLKKYLARL
jgi:predicted MFS family arabinose efflux permease